MLQYSHSLGLLWNKNILYTNSGWYSDNTCSSIWMRHICKMFDLDEFCHCPINWGFSSVIPLYTSIFLDYLGVSQIQQPCPPLLGLGWFVFIGGGGGGRRAWDSLQMWALQRLAFMHNSKGILVLWSFPLIHSLIPYPMTHPWPSLALHNHYSWFATTWQGGHMHVGVNIVEIFFSKNVNENGI